MNKNRIALVLAGISLSVAIAAPIVFIVEENSAYQTDISNFPNNADETQTSNYLNNLAEEHTATLTILAVVEVVAIILLVISLWFALKTSK